VSAGRAACALALALAAVACRRAAPASPALENREVRDDAVEERHDRGPITEDSLARFLSARFARQLADGTFVADYSGTTDVLLEELRLMGFHDLSELAAVIPPDFERGGAGEFLEDDPANIPGLVRDFMMIHDAERYFRRAWKNRWQSILPANVSALKHYVRDFRPFYDAAVLTPAEVRDAPVIEPREPARLAPAWAPAPPWRSHP
jgi:hypothetical protein